MRTPPAKPTALIGLLIPPYTRLNCAKPNTGPSASVCWSMHLRFFLLIVFILSSCFNLSSQPIQLPTYKIIYFLRVLQAKSKKKEPSAPESAEDPGRTPGRSTNTSVSQPNALLDSYQIQAYRTTRESWIQ